MLFRSSPTSFHQNEKVLSLYEDRIDKSEIPTLRGHVLSKTDQKQRRQILQFMTEYQVVLDAEQMNDASQFLAEMITDGLVQIEGQKLLMTEKGKPFLRNACIFFDEHLRLNQPQTKIFSQSI